MKFVLKGAPTKETIGVRLTAKGVQIKTHLEAGKVIDEKDVRVTLYDPNVRSNVQVAPDDLRDVLCEEGLSRRVVWVEEDAKGVLKWPGVELKGWTAVPGPKGVPKKVEAEGGDPSEADGVLPAKRGRKPKK